MFVKVRIWDIKEKQIYCLKRRRVLEVVGIQRAYLEEGHWWDPPQREFCREDRNLRLSDIQGQQDEG